jgi:hypothetical protein
MRRRYEMENFLDPTPNITELPQFGGTGTDPKSVLSGRLQGLVRQRSDIQRRSAMNNTSPLGETSPQDAQDMVDLSQSIAALGQKAANPNKGIQFAPEPRISTMPNQAQAGYGMDRARGAAAGRLNTATQARDLEIGNTENELAYAQTLEPEQPIARPTRRTALVRQYSGAR